MSWQIRWIAVLVVLALGMCAPIFGPSGSGSDAWTRTVLTADTSTSSAVAYTALSDLNFAIAASTNYRVRCEMWNETALATTGLQLQVGGPASPTEVLYFRTHCTGGSGANVAQERDNAFHTTDDGTLAGGGAAPAIPCAEQVDMIIRNGTTAGTVAFAFESEVGGSTVTVHQGSWCEYMTY